MLNTIKENRQKEEVNLDKLTLKVSEKDFFGVYDSLDEDAAYELLRRYMIYKDDEGIPRDMKIDFDDDKKVVTIVVKLHYLDSTPIIIC